MARRTLGVRLGRLFRLRRHGAQARMMARSPVGFCRRLRFEGWENLHNSPDGVVMLRAPLGSPEVASRVLELYVKGAVGGLLLPPPPEEEGIEVPLLGNRVLCSERPAQIALERGWPAVWILALPEPRGRWAIYFLPPVPTRTDDSTASFTARCLDLLEEMIRLHPEAWRPGN